MRWLKQSTAVDVCIGPFIDDADGKTAETGLTLSQADIRLKKNAGNWAQKNQSSSASHEENGYYECSLDTTDTDTCGMLRLAVAESGVLPVWEDFMVVPAAIYDAFVLGTEFMPVDHLKIEWSISGTTLTVKKPDDTTTAYTKTLTATPGADPITGVS